MEQNLFWEANKSSASQEIPRIFRFCHLQEPTTCPYPETDQSGPNSPLILLLEDPF